MAQTLVSLYVHIIFSTKYRQNIILEEDEPDLYAYIGGIANNNKIEAPGCRRYCQSFALASFYGQDDCAKRIDRGYKTR